MEQGTKEARIGRSDIKLDVNVQRIVFRRVGGSFCCAFAAAMQLTESSTPQVLPQENRRRKSSDKGKPADQLRRVFYAETRDGKDMGITLTCFAVKSVTDLNQDDASDRVRRG